jgi:hypothetical protein
MGWKTEELGFNSWYGQRFSSYSLDTDESWSPTILRYNGYRVPEADHSPPPKAEVKNGGATTCLIETVSTVLERLLCSLNKCSC